MVNPAGARAIPLALKSLEERPVPPGGVLSAFVITSPNRVLGRGYLLSYRNACKELQATLPPSELDAFHSVAARVERYLTDGFTPSAEGLALFASGPDYLSAIPLPYPPTEHVAWGARAEIGPLVAALDEYERIGVALFDKERARLFTVFLGEIEEQQTIEDEVPGKQATGGWFALAQTRYARHHEEHVRRHVDRTIGALMSLQRAHPFDRLLLAGPDEALATLRHHLPRPLRARLGGTLTLELFASDADVVRAVRAAAERIERQREMDTVTELLDAAVGSRHVVLGVEDTLAALNEGRAHVLVVDGAFGAAGRECGACARLVADGDPCPACGQAAERLDGLGEAVIEHALAQGARIEQVSGEAAGRLREYGGLAAWTRY